MNADMTAQDDLAAGRELDAEVAEKVMGWTFAHTEDEYDPRTPGSLTLVGVTPDQRRLAVIPHYSTDLSAAGQVLVGWSVTLAHAEGLPWHCHLMRCTREGEWQNGEGHADTAPLAICRAALQAVSG